MGLRLPYLSPYIAGMKTTVEISDDLLRQAKEYAARRGIPLREHIGLSILGHKRKVNEVRAWLKEKSGQTANCREGLTC